MNYDDKFPELGNFLSCYFNEDWVDMYESENREADALEVVRFYKTEDSEEGIRKTAEQLEELLKLQHDEEALREILFYDLSSYYRAAGDNWTYREWLEKALEILRNPNEKSKITGRANDGYEPPTEEMLAILRE